MSNGFRLVKTIESLFTTWISMDFFENGETNRWIFMVKSHHHDPALQGLRTIPVASNSLDTTSWRGEGGVPQRVPPLG